MTEFLPWLSVGFAAVLLVLVVLRDINQKGEVDRLHQVNRDLLDRLMSRDFGEYRVARAEEREAEAEKGESPYPSQAEGYVDYQMMGDDYDPGDFQRGGM